MHRLACPGLPASWLNGWLAAVGATKLDTRVRLHWTSDRTPLAVLSAADIDPVEALVASWPDTALLTDMPIAEHWQGVGHLRRKVPEKEFAQRVRAARSHPYSWTLSSTLTDLYINEKGEVAHAPFDPAGPGTIKWLHHRLTKVHGQVAPSSDRIDDSLAGRALRVKDNGLGFDQTRFGSQSDDNNGLRVDPVVEVLAFFGLALLPVRGEGTDCRMGRFFDVGESQRGWLRTEGNRRGRRFMWPAWSQPLDFPGIDALMDVWTPRSKAAWGRIGVHAGWQTVQYMRRGSADRTTAFGAEQL